MPTPAIDCAVLGLRLRVCVLSLQKHWCYAEECDQLALTFTNLLSVVTDVIRCSDVTVLSHGHVYWLNLCLPAGPLRLQIEECLYIMFRMFDGLKPSGSLPFKTGDYRTREIERGRRTDTGRRGADKKPVAGRWRANRTSFNLHSSAGREQPDHVKVDPACPEKAACVPAGPGTCASLSEPVPRTAHRTPQPAHAP